MTKGEKSFLFWDQTDLVGDLLTIFLSPLFIYVLYSNTLTANDDILKEAFLMGVVILFILLYLFFILGKLYEFFWITKKIPYLIINEEGVKPKGKKIIQWEKIFSIKVGGFSDKKLFRSKSGNILITLINFEAQADGDLSGKTLLNKENVYLSMERLHFIDKSVFKAMTTCAPRHVKFFTPIGY